MRIADVCAFYTPAGGGVRTYVEAKLRAAARFGHEMIVIAPGERHEVDQARPRRGAGDHSVAAPAGRPALSLFRRRARAPRGARRVAAGPCRSLVAMVERDDGRPLAGLARAARWSCMPTRLPLMLIAGSAVCVGDRPIDRWFGWFWRHLRGLGRMFDTVVCANAQLARAASARRDRAIAETIRDGRRRRASFRRRCVRRRLREQALQALGLDADATLLVGVGRFSAEKRWDMVMRAVADGRATPARSGCCWSATARSGCSSRCSPSRSRACAVLPRIDDRDELARLAGERRCAGPRLRGRDLLHGRGRGARERHPADRPGPRRGAPTSSSPGAGASYRAAIRGIARAGDRPLHRSRPGIAAGRRRSRQPGADHGRAFRRAVRPLREGWRRTRVAPADGPRWLCSRACRVGARCDRRYAA